MIDQLVEEQVAVVGGNDQHAGVWSPLEDVIAAVLLQTIGRAFLEDQGYAGLAAPDADCIGAEQTEEDLVAVAGNGAQLLVRLMPDVEDSRPADWEEHV